MIAESPAALGTMDAVAVARWWQLACRQAVQGGSPWLHEEVATRMLERLCAIKLPMQRIAHWHPLVGGIAAQNRLVVAYPHAQFWLIESPPAYAQFALAQAAKGGLFEQMQRLEWVAAPQLSSMDMVWSNMALHMHARPQELMQQWYEALSVGGFVMFSCLGARSLQELRVAYAQQGWAQPAHAFMGLSEWGTLLLEAGFSEPVLDTQCLRLTFSSAERALEELRELGRNLCGARAATPRGRAWRAALLSMLDKHRDAHGRVVLTFELVYGHAVKSQRQERAGEASTSIGLESLRRMLQQG